MISQVKLQMFTAFEGLSLSASPGINVLVGANATGKTHILKVAYAACDVSRTRGSYPEKLVRVFLPYNNQLGRLAHRQVGSCWATAAVRREGGAELRVRFSNHAQTPVAAEVQGARTWGKRPVECAYLPVKEMLAHAPGFRSLYSSREIHFEETYADIIDRAYRPLPKGPPSVDRGKLLEHVRKAIGGRVVLKHEEFFLRGKQGNLEFTLLAEGIRKLALLWLLVLNNTLPKGSVLFWDEPEANLNPNMIGNVVQVLLELQRMGVQVFLATHDYVLLKELDLRSLPGDELTYHSLYRSPDGVIRLSSTADYESVHPNAIADTFGDLYDRDVRRATKEASDA